jgi:hypothetical protein
LLSELCDAVGVEHIAAEIPAALELTMEGEVFSVFWLLAAFVGGGLCGVLVMALMSLSGGLPKQSTRVLQAELRGLDLGGSTVV